MIRLAHHTKKEYTKLIGALFDEIPPTETFMYGLA